MALPVATLHHNCIPLSVCPTPAAYYQQKVKLQYTVPPAGAGSWRIGPFCLLTGWHVNRPIALLSVL